MQKTKTWRKTEALGMSLRLSSQRGARRVVCLGGAVLDRKYRAIAPLIEDTSNPVQATHISGGVARNVAENLARLGTLVRFISVVGKDEAGRAILGRLRDCGVDTREILVSKTGRTAEYVALLENTGALRFGLADMEILNEFQPAVLERVWPKIDSADWIFADCNLPAETLAALLAHKKNSRVRLAIDAVSTAKVVRLPDDLTAIDVVFMNLAEARVYLAQSLPPATACLEDALEAALGLQRKGAAEAVVSLGAQGMAVASNTGARFFTALPARPVDMTGAGDAMIAATVHQLLAGMDLFQAARVGSLMGALTTECSESVHPALSPRFLAENLSRLDEGEGRPEDLK